MADLTCAICLEHKVKPRALACGHSFCGLPKPCHKGVTSNRTSFKCPICRTEFDENGEISDPLLKELFEKQQNEPAPRIPDSTRHRPPAEFTRLPTSLFLPEESSSWHRSESALSSFVSSQLPGFSHLAQLSINSQRNGETSSSRDHSITPSSSRSSITPTAPEEDEVYEDYSGFSFPDYQPSAPLDEQFFTPDSDFRPATAESVWVLPETPYVSNRETGTRIDQEKFQGYREESTRTPTAGNRDGLETRGSIWVFPTSPSQNSRLSDSPNSGWYFSESP